MPVQTYTYMAQWKQIHYFIISLIIAQEMLMECEYNAHLKPLSVMNVTDKWDKDLVDKRTEKMLSIIWDRVSNWIFSE